MKVHHILAIILTVCILVNLFLVILNVRNLLKNQEVIDNNQKVVDLIEKRKAELNEYASLVSAQSAEYESWVRKARDCEWELNEWRK